MIQALTKFSLVPLVVAMIAGPAYAQGMLASEATLCRSQLDLLVDGEKLTEDEQLRFEEQCDCLERAAAEGAVVGKTACAEPKGSE